MVTLQIAVSSTFSILYGGLHAQTWIQSPPFSLLIYLTV